MLLDLDLKDRRLLYELDKNARVSFTELGKRIGTSKEVARYRLGVLEDAGVINNYFTIIDVSRLGFTNFKAFIKLQNAGENEEKKLIDWLVKNPNVVWVVSSDGQFDIAFGLRARNIEQYANQLAELDNKFGDFFLQRQIAPIVRGQYFYRDYLIGKTTAKARETVFGPVLGKREIGFGGVPRQEELDDLDWGVLTALGKNGRASITDIAKQLRASPDTVGKRLRQLEKLGVIQNYILVLNNSPLGQLHYKVLTSLRSVTEKRYRELVEYCKSHPNIFYIVKTFGGWEFEIDLEVPNTESFRNVMRELKEKFADIIRDYSYISIYKIHKYNFCPSRP